MFGDVDEGIRQIKKKISWHCQEKVADNHVSYAVQEGSKTASKEAQNGPLVPEMSVVRYGIIHCQASCPMRPRWYVSMCLTS
jgi:hypothetical protein